MICNDRSGLTIGIARRSGIGCMLEDAVGSN